MPETECIHGLMVGTCSLCKAKTATPEPSSSFQRKPLFRRGGEEARTMTAKFDGACENCGDDIDAGVDTIRYDEELGAWIHAHCFRHWGHDVWR